MAALLGDDLDLLDEAFALLLPEPGDDQSNAVAGGVVAKQRSVNRSRERQKEELEQLRHVVRELEAELDALNKYHHAQRVASVRRRHEVDAKEMWKGTALRQFWARKQAELLNTKLRTALAAQRRNAAQLLQLVRRTPMEKKVTDEVLDEIAGHIDSQPMKVTAQWLCAALPPPDADALGETEQQERLASMCARWEAPFSVFKYSKRSTFTEVRVIKNAFDEVVLEAQSSALYPFSVEPLSGALWSFWTRGEVIEDDFCLSSGGTSHGDQISYSLHIATTRGDVSGVLVGGGMRRKFYTASGEFVQTSTARGAASNYPAHGQGDPARIVISRDQWVRVKSAPDRGDGSPPMSIVQYIIRASIKDTGERPDRASVEYFTRMHRGIITEGLRCAFEAAERRLLRSNE